MWLGIVAQTRGTDFDPRLSLLRACVLQIKWGLHKAVSSAYVFKIATLYARKIERSTGHANIELIEPTVPSRSGKKLCQPRQKLSESRI